MRARMWVSRDEEGIQKFGKPQQNHWFVSKRSLKYFQIRISLSLHHGERIWVSMYVGSTVQLIMMIIFKRRRRHFLVSFESGQCYYIIFLRRRRWWKKEKKKKKEKHFHSTRASCTTFSRVDYGIMKRGKRLGETSSSVFDVLCGVKQWKLTEADRFNFFKMNKKKKRLVSFLSV